MCTRRRRADRSPAAFTMIDCGDFERPRLMKCEPSNCYVRMEYSIISYNTADKVYTLTTQILTGHCSLRRNNAVHLHGTIENVSTRGLIFRRGRSARTELVLRARPPSSNAENYAISTAAADMFRGTFYDRPPAFHRKISVDNAVPRELRVRSVCVQGERRCFRADDYHRRTTISKRNRKPSETTPGGGGRSRLCSRCREGTATFPFQYLIRTLCFRTNYYRRRFYNRYRYTFGFEIENQDFNIECRGHFFRVLSVQVGCET